jgi:hypothetical protein
MFSPWSAKRRASGKDLPVQHGSQYAKEENENCHWSHGRGQKF